MSSDQNHTTRVPPTPEDAEIFRRRFRRFKDSIPDGDVMSALGMMQRFTRDYMELPDAQR